MDDLRMHHGSSIPLGAAIRALPMEKPPGDGWTLVAGRLPGPRKRARWPWAVAAGLLAVMLLPQMQLQAPHSALPSVSSAAVESVAVTSLMAESARLEQLVAAASDDGASSATAAALSLDLQDQVQQVDEQLAASRQLAQQLPLWQRRVQLLRNVAAVEASRHFMSAQGRSLDVALVAAY